MRKLGLEPSRPILVTAINHPPHTASLICEAKQVSPPHKCDLRNSEQILCRKVSPWLAGPHKQASYELGFIGLPYLNLDS